MVDKIGTLAGAQSIRFDGNTNIRVSKCEDFITLLMSGVGTQSLSDSRATTISVYGDVCSVVNCTATPLNLYTHAKVTNCEIGTLVLMAGANNANNALIENCRIQGLTDNGVTGVNFSNCNFIISINIITNASSSGWNISNCYFYFTVTIKGDSFNFTNNQVDGDLIVFTSADDNTVCNNRVGNSGAGTITIQAAANRTMVMGNRTDTAIADGGAGTMPDGGTIGITDVNVIF